MAGQGEEQLERDADINRLDRTHHVAGALGFQDPRTFAPRGIIPTMPLSDCLVPYIHEAGFGGPLQMCPFDYDMPLDVAYHLRLRTNGDPISRCVREFRAWYGTDMWEVAEEYLGG
ncbi:hypothetical protein PIB30_023926 [Stylosanthes scabra]|uniref:Uncharacterized protein n=1 Tax=Stylosanthes scabra TaxID=79078 RepID=A0ABU6V7R1_9FABA|nr:hypothetical protein [Stylosanthes scabra]